MRFTFSVVTAAMVLLCGCGGGPTIHIDPPTPKPAIAVSFRTTPTSVEAGSSTAFVAEVLNSSNQGLNWHVNGIEGGNASVGTISLGVYTAPASVLSAMQITVTATSHADTTKSASVTLTVTPVVKLTIEPAVTSLGMGVSQQFVANMSDGTTPKLEWLALYGGTMTADGLFTAPVAYGNASIQVSTVGAPYKQANATIAIVASKAILNGPYVFTYDGQDTAGHVAMGGSFVADGGGGITSGICDVVSRTGVNADITFTGSYSVGGDGRATMILNFPSGSRIWRLAIPSTESAAFAEMQGPHIGSGRIEKQSTVESSPQKWTWILASTPTPRGPALVGMVDVDGAGNVTSGAYDVHRAGQPGVQGTFSGGTFTVASTRTTATLQENGTARNFRVYAVNSARVFAVSLDPALDAVLLGEFTERTNMFPAPFSGYLLSASGISGSQPWAMAGQAEFRDGQVSAGVIDVNDGSRSQNYSGVTGTYSAAGGRGTLQLSTTGGVYNFVSYSAGFRSVFVQAEDGSQVVGALEMAPMFDFGYSEYASCLSNSFFVTASSGGPASLTLAHVLPGSEDTSGNVADIYEHDLASMGLYVAPTVTQDDSYSFRRVLSLNATVDRQYAVYGCRAVATNPSAVESGVLLPAKIVSVPIWWGGFGW